MSRILVTGGAGFIGSITVDLLVARGDSVVVVDDLSRGFVESLNSASEFVKADVGDREVIGALLERHKPDAVIHFAGYIAVGESVSNPGPYITRNVSSSNALLEVMIDNGTDKIVFSSSAAVYGVPDSVPIREDQTKRPTSPYGWTKWAFEEVLGFYDTAHGLRSASLRYFNAAGASLTRAERHEPETHLIPNVLRAASEGSTVSVFGTDYPTVDGTAVRDYIHVVDLAEAHLAAVDYLLNGGASTAMNIGSGVGLSVSEVIAAVEDVTGIEVDAKMVDRRAGDPPELVADPTLAQITLGWEATRSDIGAIVESAWSHFDR